MREEEGEQKSQGEEASRQEEEEEGYRAKAEDRK